jgi:hypothetical protein
MGMTFETEDLDVSKPDEGRVRPGAVAAGVVLLVAGAGMFLGTRQGLDIRFGQLIGPMVLIAIGASMVVERSAFVVGRRVTFADGGRRPRLRRRGGPSSGIWLIGIGLWMAMSQNHVFGLSYHNSWPLLIVLSGILMVIRGFK